MSALAAASGGSAAVSASEPICSLKIIDEDHVIPLSRNKLFLPARAGNEGKRQQSTVFISYDHWDQTLRLCSWETGKILSGYHDNKLVQKYVGCDVSADGEILAMVTNSCTIEVFHIDRDPNKRQVTMDPSSNNYGDSSMPVDKSGLNAKLSSGGDLAKEPGSVRTGEGSGATIAAPGIKQPYYIDKLATLSGHTRLIRCVCVSKEFEVIISGSDDSTCIIWDLNRLVYLRHLVHDGAVTCAAISPTGGDIITFCRNESKKQNVLRLWTINGVLISQRIVKSRVNCLLFTGAPEGSHRNVILCGTESGTILILDALELSTVHTLRPPTSLLGGSGSNVGLSQTSNQSSSQSGHPTLGAITALAVDPKLSMLYSGDENGTIVAWGVETRR